jgi:hypothetical protein
MKKRLLANIICVIAIIGGAIGFTGCSPENGAYYLMENGELKTEQFFKLNSGKWEDDDGASGTYKTENGKIRLYIVLFGQEEELVTGTYGDGLLIFDMGGGMKEIYVSDAHNHSFNAWETVRLNCVQDGLQRRACACGFTEEQTTAALGYHTFGDWETVKYNCLEDGLQKRYCACGEEEEEILPKIGNHTFGEWVNTIEPTPDNPGEAKKTCHVCGETETRKQYYIATEYYTLLEEAEKLQNYAFIYCKNGRETCYYVDNGIICINYYKQFLYKEDGKYIKLDYDETEEKYRKTFTDPFDCDEILEIFKNLTILSYDEEYEEYAATYKGKKYKLIAGDSRIVIDELDWVKSYKMEAVGRIKVTLPKEEIIIDDTEIK